MSVTSRESLKVDDGQTGNAVSALKSAFALQGAHGSESCTEATKCERLYIPHPLTPDNCAEPLLALVPDAEYLRASFVVA